jgi:hypothetical protein
MLEFIKVSFGMLMLSNDRECPPTDPVHIEPCEPIGSSDPCSPNEDPLPCIPEVKDLYPCAPPCDPFWESLY